MADNDQSSGEIVVLVKVFGGLREITGGELAKGTATVRLSGEASVSDVIGAIAAQAPMLAERIRSGSGYLNVLLNGRNVRFLAGMDTAVFDGATVSILPPIGGG
jgi:sulfur-carrier protein